MERERRLSLTALQNDATDDYDGSSARASEPVAKKKAKNDVGLSLIQKMGYTGKGLGKNEQGITAAIEAVSNRGRLGLGAEKADVTDDLDDKFVWTPEKEEELISLEESIQWLKYEDTHVELTDDKLKSWIHFADDNCDKYTFCDPEIYDTIDKCRSSLDNFSEQQMMKGRSQSNPFEQIGRGIFQNRAAMKMANIDAAFKFMLTRDDESDDDILFFGDICAGPGGFSEYVLWRKGGWRAHGFGMTLKSGRDWQLDDFITGTETFEIHYGHSESSGDDAGDIYQERNLTAFHEFIKKRVPQGLRFMMADGGFSVKGDENAQETLSKRLYLCQFICALQNVKINGHFVCKLFDCFTPFTVGLIYLIHRSFDKVCIFKPNTSRPANSERYLICKRKRQCTELIRDHLLHLNKLMDAKDNRDIVSIVPLHVIDKESKFFDYIYRSNNELGFRQIIFLNKLKVFALEELENPHYGKYNEQCFELWQIPLDQTYRQKYIDTVRNLTEPPESYFAQLIAPAKGDNLLLKKPMPLTSQSFDYSAEKLSLRIAFPTYKVKIFAVNDPSGHMETRPIAKEKRGLILVISRAKIYFKDVTSVASKFELMEDSELNSRLILNLPPRTLVLGEILYEYSSNSQNKFLAVHLLDCFHLAGEDVTRKSVDERSRLLSAFTRSIQNAHLEAKNPYNNIRCRSLYDLADIEEIVASLEPTIAKKSHKGQIVIYQKVAENKFIIPTGVYFVPVVDTVHCLKCYSRSEKRYYDFNRKNNQKIYGTMEGMEATIHHFFSNSSCFWPWKLDEPYDSDFPADSRGIPNEKNARFASIYQVIDEIRRIIDITTIAPK